MTKKGRTYRIRREKQRKLDSKDKEIVLTLIELSGNKQEIRVIPNDYIHTYYRTIMDIFYKSKCLVKYYLLYKNKILDENKTFYDNNIYKNQELTIVFSNIERPLELFQPYKIDEITQQSYDRLLDETIRIINLDPLPDDIYYHIRNLFEITRKDIRMIWFDHDIKNPNDNTNEIPSRCFGIYRSYCIYCLEGTNGFGHECLPSALIFRQILPQLIEILNEYEPNYQLTF